jgi:hypothetical protein
MSSSDQAIPSGIETTRQSPKVMFSGDPAAIHRLHEGAGAGNAWAAAAAPARCSSPSMQGFSLIHQLQECAHA